MLILQILYLHQHNLHHLLIHSLIHFLLIISFHLNLLINHLYHQYHVIYLYILDLMILVNLIQILIQYHLIILFLQSKNHLFLLYVIINQHSILIYLSIYQLFIILHYYNINHLVTCILSYLSIRHSMHSTQQHFLLNYLFHQLHEIMGIHSQNIEQIIFLQLLFFKLLSHLNLRYNISIKLILKLLDCLIIYIPINQMHLLNYVDPIQ